MSRYRLVKRRLSCAQFGTTVWQRSLLTERGTNFPSFWHPALVPRIFGVHVDAINRTHMPLVLQHLCPNHELANRPIK